MKKILVTRKLLQSNEDRLKEIYDVNLNINDELYSDSKARMLLRRGYSLNKIHQSLRHKGIDSKYIKQSIDKIKEDQIEPDFVSALKLCKRRRIGPVREEGNRPLFFKKDISILARSGFSYEISKKILTFLLKLILYRSPTLAQTLELLLYAL